MRKFFPASVSACLLAVAMCGALLAGVSPLRKIAQVELPGPKGKRFDYVTVDPDDHFVIVAHMHGDQTYFVDTRTNQLAATITDTPGVEYVPDQRKVYTSNSGDNTIGVIDIAQRKVIMKLKTEAKPDGSTYAAPFHKLYVSDERGKAVAIVDVRSDTIMKTLHFDSETGMPQYDPVAKLAYVNLQDTERFAVIDPQDDRVLSQFPVAGCRGNHGMALAPEQRRAFLVCEGNNLLAVFDLEKHTVVQTLPLPEGGDVVKADPGRGRIFVACYSGAITAIQALGSGQYKKIADAPVEKRVHSLAINPETGYLYVPEEQEKGTPASRLIVYALPGEVR
ncbi:MAG TPA: YncE family protein [Candidatus Acidoferrum sp.]|nr:YncE family protein [Candidatus Acidoferrum sp.]